MLLTDIRDGTILEVNKVAVDFYGYSKEQLLSMNISQINVDGKQEVERQMKRVANHQSHYFMFKHRLASGEIRDVEIYSGKIHEDGQILLHSIIHDITKSRLAKEQVNRLSQAVEQSPVSIMITDIKGSIQYVNLKHCHITGYKKE